MKNHISTHGWEFDFDYDKTREYYKNNENRCTCAPCRNFYQNVDSLPLDLVSFLEQFGIDVSRPIEQCSDFADKERRVVDNDLSYVVHGIASSMEGYEIDIGFANVVITDKEHVPSTEMDDPIFVFLIFNLRFPWTVEDDLDECYPEKKTLKEKIRNHFRRLKKS